MNRIWIVCFCLFLFCFSFCFCFVCFLCFMFCVLCFVFCVLFLFLFSCFSGYGDRNTGATLGLRGFWRKKIRKILGRLGQETSTKQEKTSGQEEICSKKILDPHHDWTWCSIAQRSSWEAKGRLDSKRRNDWRRERCNTRYHFGARWDGQYFSLLV